MRYFSLLAVNAITLARVPLIVICGWFMLHQQWMPAWAFFLVSCLTDVSDGQCARWWRVETKFGAIADLASDCCIYWILMVNAVIYYWLYHFVPPSREAILQLAFGVPTSLLLIFVLTAEHHKKIVQWWRQKGNFWLGVIPDAAIGLWISWHAGPAPLAITVVYGFAAIVVNREKLRQFI